MMQTIKSHVPQTEFKNMHRVGTYWVVYEHLTEL